MKIKVEVAAVAANDAKMARLAQQLLTDHQNLMKHYNFDLPRNTTTLTDGHR